MKKDKAEIHIFLAHASEDKPQVRNLYQRLKQEGFRPWMDEQDLLPGQKWRDEISRTIQRSDIFIACLSSQSVSKRGYVQREFRQALNQMAEMPEGAFYLIPLKLDECDIPDLRQSEYGLNLRDIQWLDYANRDGWERLLKAIARKTGESVIINQPPSHSPTKLSKTASLPITRKQFLKWAGLGGASLVTAVAAREILRDSSPISVAEPKYISPTEGAPKAFGLPLWTAEFETVTVDKRGEVVKRYPNKQAEFFKEDLGNGVTLDMVYIPSGSFKMGSEESNVPDEKPPHDVSVPAFFMGMFEVTTKQWFQVLGFPYPHLKVDKRPVHVSWNEAAEFCEKLRQKTERPYRLPSEAEWEYACRANTTTPFYFGETITTDLVNYFENWRKDKLEQSDDKRTEVGKFPPNAFGLYDMHGNVSEWCQDTWHVDYHDNPPLDGSAWIDNSHQDRVLRGGSFSNQPDACRSANRFHDIPDNFSSNYGFRIVCDTLPS